MINIDVAFDGSWTNKLMRDDFTPRFTSARQLRNNSKSLNILNGESVFNIPDCENGYNVVSEFENTISGIVARLMGEVSRVNTLKKNPKFSKICQSTTFDISTDHLWSENITLRSTKMNDEAAMGSGVFSSENMLYKENHISVYLMSHFKYSLDECLTHLETLKVSKEWHPQSPTEFISVYKECKAYVDQNSKKCPNTIEKIKHFLRNHDKWSDSGNIYGAILVYKLSTINPEDMVDLVKTKTVSIHKNITGISSTGNIGNMSEKDVYAGSGADKYTQNLIPYSTEVAVKYVSAKGKNAMQIIPLGVIKKTGSVKICINLDDTTLEQEVYDKIQSSGVNIFHFGKKGIAHVTNIERKCHV